MSAFQPISPRAALQLLEAADIGVDCARLLADLAEAGRVKGYARLVETSAPGQAITEVRDGRIDRSIWKRIVIEDKVADVYAVGSVRLGNDAAGSVSVLGIRFDEKSVQAAVADHGLVRPVPASRAAPARKVVAEKPDPVSDRDLPETVAAPAAPRRSLAPDAIGASIDEAAAVLGLGRGTIYKLIDSGTLDSKKIGRRRLVSAESIRGLMADPH